jgi:hypothetical protein
MNVNVHSADFCISHDHGDDLDDVVDAVMEVVQEVAEDVSAPRMLLHVKVTGQPMPR